ncbi:copper homeostasis periplasmic binding protein CopC [Rhizobium sp. A37_96]
MKCASTIFALGSLGCILAASPALAHAHLEGETPSDRSIVRASPSSLVLDFTEALNIAFSGIDIIDATGQQIQYGKPALTNGDQNLTVPLQSELGPGSYTVKWHVLATDGHKTEGRYSFTVKP